MILLTNVRMMDLLMSQTGMLMNVSTVSFHPVQVKTILTKIIAATTTECYDCTTTSKYDIFHIYYNTTYRVSSVQIIRLLVSFLLVRKGKENHRVQTPGLLYKKTFE